jgi:hypothetical protein
LALGLTALAGPLALAQYSTPVGTGAAKPKTLRATAVLEWTGTLQKPNASRLMPVAVWDGERYQPAGLYLANPAPLAFETGTQYVLERVGEPEGLFNVRGAAQLNGDWIGMGKFQPQAAPPPPPKLKASKQLPALSNGRPEKSDPGDSDRPTLHRKGGDSSGSDTSTAAPSSGSKTSTTTTSQPAATPDSDRPTLHKRSSSDDSTSAPNGTGSTPSSSSPSSSPTSTGNSGSTSSSSSSGSSGSGSNSGSSTTSSTDPNAPTLHKRSSSDDSTSASTDPDRPTLHQKADPASPDVDPDRPTLHRSHGSSAGLVTTSGNIDPDRPHLRYGKPDTTEASMLPAKLEGAPTAMQQIVAVSDVATGEPHSYKYQWSSPDDASKMQDGLAKVAAQLAAQALAPPHSGANLTRTTAHPTTHTAKPPAAALPSLAEPDFKTFELSYSGGATVIYSAHTEDDGPRRVYVTLIAQPDFYGQPQVLFKQVARGDRLDVTPAMQLVDAVDTDGDGRAELIFQLNGGSVVAQAAQPERATAPTTDRAFAIYKIVNGHADQVFTTGPLP